MTCMGCLGCLDACDHCYCLFCGENGQEPESVLASRCLRSTWSQQKAQMLLCMTTSLPAQADDLCSVASMLHASSSKPQAPGPSRRASRPTARRAWTHSFRDTDHTQNSMYDVPRVQSLQDHAHLTCSQAKAGVRGNRVSVYLAFGPAH